MYDCFDLQFVLLHSSAVGNLCTVLHTMVASCCTRCIRNVFTMAYNTVALTMALTIHNGWDTLRSVGALIAGAPLAVSRAFRTELQAFLVGAGSSDHRVVVPCEAAAFLLTECSTRGAAARPGVEVSSWDPQITIGFNTQNISVMDVMVCLGWLGGIYP